MLAHVTLQEGTKETIERVVGQYKDKEQLVSPIDIRDTLNISVLLIAGKKNSIASVEHTHQTEFTLKSKLRFLILALRA